MNKQVTLLSLGATLFFVAPAVSETAYHPRTFAGCSNTALESLEETRQQTWTNLCQRAEALSVKHAKLEDQVKQIPESSEKDAADMMLSIATKSFAELDSQLYLRDVCDAERFLNYIEEDTDAVESFISEGDSSSLMQRYHLHRSVGMVLAFVLVLLCVATLVMLICCLKLYLSLCDF